MTTNQARRTLDYLYEKLQKGGSVERSDVEGAIRMAVAADDQLSLPTMERKAKLTMAQVSTRKKTIIARTPTQDAYIRALERAELVFGVGPAKHRQDLSRRRPCRSAPGAWRGRKDHPVAPGCRG